MISILIVEDDPLQAEAVKLQLVDCGYRIAAIVSDGEAAIKQARTSAPDIVLMDIMLPGKMDGIQAAQEIRECCDVPVIFLTAYDNDEYFLRAKVAESYAYLLKPSTSREFKLAIEFALYRHNAERTTRSMLEKAVKESIATLNEAQSIAHIGSWRYSLSSGKLTWSDELYRIYGVSPELFTPSVENLINLIHPDDQSAMPAWIDSCAAGHAPGALVFRCIRPDGTIHYIEGQGKLTLHADGNPGYLSGTAQDITERKQAEELQLNLMRQLEDKDLAKSRFLAAAGHDLRQPLAAANLYIDTLKLTEPTPQQNKIIQRLDRSMAAFNGLLDALLNMSKLESGMIKPEFTLINVTELFYWMEHNFAPLANEKSLGFKLYFPMKETLVVRSDIGLVKSLLMNLVSNAIKFTSRGAILISVRRRGSDALFQIWDTGIGIPGGQAEHIFDEFYQINNPQRDRTVGLGLGLSIAQRSITLLGEKIACRSQFGRGSVFEFRLPLVDTSSAEVRRYVTEAAQEDMVAWPSILGKRFVVVEDDALVAQAMSDLLEGMGGEVRRFHGATDALRNLHIEFADYFIVDYMLSGALNGIQFLNLLRQRGSNPIKAVLVTGDTSSTFVREVAKCDWPVLFKPVNMSKLICCLSAQERKRD